MTGRPLIPEAEFIEAFEAIGPAALAKRLQCQVRAVYMRRADIEKRIGRALVAPSRDRDAPDNPREQHPQRAECEVANGTVIVGSDLHAWPGEPSTAFRAMVKFVKEMKPKAVVMNGDVIDGASISRHPPIGWEKQPTLIEEMEAAQERLHAIAIAAPKAKLFWPLGNHDARFSTRLATVAPEYAQVHGTRLQDHFGERWTPCWSVWINPQRRDGVVCKHRFKGGIHAPHNNTLWAGKTVVTGHLHSPKVIPISDYNGTRFGVDAGCLADVDGRQFLYTEDSPKNWVSAFAVLTFRDGALLWPELVVKVDDKHVQFRGEIIAV